MWEFHDISIGYFYDVSMVLLLDVYEYSYGIPMGLPKDVYGYDISIEITMWISEGISMVVL